MTVIRSRQTSIDMLVVRKAIEDMVMLCTGWPDSDRFRIFPRTMKIPQVPYPYITYMINIPQQVVGHDEMRKYYDSSQPNGSQLTNELRNQRDIVVGFQAFSMSPVPGLDDDGFYSAQEYLNMIQDSIDLPSVSDRLYEARLVFVDILNAGDVSLAIGPIGQGRAVMDIRFRTAYTTSEQYTWIESVAPPSYVWLLGGFLECYTTLSAGQLVDVKVNGGALVATSTLSGKSP
jgi:hypothetical protein